MAPTVKWQRWEAAAWSWSDTSATGPCALIRDEIQNWLNVVNTHTSNAGRQITLIRGPESSTATNYCGITFKAGANNNTQFGYMFYGTLGSTSARTTRVGASYTDSTANGGYGSIGITPGKADSAAFIASNTDTDILICYDTTEGEEFLTIGHSQSGSTSYADGLVIFKARTGEWVMAQNDGSPFCAIGFFDDGVGQEWETCTRDGDDNSSVAVAATTYTAPRYGFGRISAGTILSVEQDAYTFTAANPALLGGANILTGTRYVYPSIGTGQDVYLLASFTYGPWILIDAR